MSDSRNSTDATLSPNAFPNHNPDVLPPLRFENADVIIKLSADSKDWIFVHKSLIQATLPSLAPNLKREWNEPELITHPGSGEAFDIYTLALKQVESTFILGDAKNITLPEPGSEVQDFDMSCLSTGDWPKHDGGSYPVSVEDNAIMAHKTILAIIYGYKVSLEAICTFQPGRRNRMSSEVLYLHATVDRISLICAYAEYYGCFKNIVAYMTDLLLRHPAIWRSVADGAGKYLMLAKKLKCSKLYVDAMRHLISHSSKPLLTNPFRELAYYLGIDEKAAETLFKPKLNEMRTKQIELHGSLMKLQLSNS